ncbi:hypothetical protein CEXT_742051 [Caerostris extrusa]|uniref:Uncharacterized protein n=1 Tax=Caerostris extrusa TaxID=172846 RepID=A0AAV4SLF3_CAEEX|nr:hypothetical protein CEXT_742051 [Caerostris extrusa]
MKMAADESACRTPELGLHWHNSWLLAAWVEIVSLPITRNSFKSTSSSVSAASIHCWSSIGAKASSIPLMCSMSSAHYKRFVSISASFKLTYCKLPCLCMIMQSDLGVSRPSRNATSQHAVFMDALLTDVKSCSARYFISLAFAGSCDDLNHEPV